MRIRKSCGVMKQPLLIDPVVNSASAAVKPKSAIRPCEGFEMTTLPVRLALALSIVTVLIATSASAQVSRDCLRHPNARYKTVESAEVKERLGRPREIL
jgi:hypothetical protein